MTDHEKNTLDSAEVSFLASVFADAVDLDDVTILPAHFSTPERAEIMREALKLHYEGRVSTPESLQPGISSKALAEAIRIRSCAPSPDPVGYSRSIRDGAVRRALAQAAAEIAKLAGDKKVSLDEAIANSERVLSKAADDGTTETAVHIAGTVEDVLAEVESRHSSPTSGPVGITTGLRDLDKIMRGWTAGDLVTTAGRPGMGKSSITQTWSLAAARSGAPVLIFSVEQSKSQLAQRLICSDANVSQHRTVSGALLPEELKRFRESAAAIKALPIYVEPVSGLTPDRCRKVSRQFVRRHGVRLIIIDHIGLMRVPGIGADQLREAITEITRTLKEIAKSLSVTVIAVSQLNREVERREDKRPMLSDLRDSGSIEQDSDVVLFLYRDEYYNKEKTLPDLRGVAEIIVGKQRNGAVGFVLANYHSPSTRFSDREGSNPNPKREDWNA